MGFHEVFITSLVVTLLWNIFWKWQKVFLVVILMELVATMVIVSFFSFFGTNLFFIIIFVFFVSEALILISSLYNSMRVSGVTYGSLSLI